MKFEQLKNEKNIKEAEYDRKFKNHDNILMLQTAKTKMLENQLDISKKNIDELTENGRKENQTSSYLKSEIEKLSKDLLSSQKNFQLKKMLQKD